MAQIYMPLTKKQIKKLYSVVGLCEGESQEVQNRLRYSRLYFYDKNDIEKAGYYLAVVLFLTKAISADTFQYLTGTQVDKFYTNVI